MEELKKDKRFAHVLSDPRFRRLSKAERKVKIDQRFKSMFKDKRFKLKYSVDKRGRPVNLTTNENLRKYYELTSEEESSGSSEEEEEENDEEEEEEKEEEEEDSEESSVDMDDSDTEIDVAGSDDDKSSKQRKKQTLKEGGGLKIKQKIKETSAAKTGKPTEKETKIHEEPDISSGIDFARGEGLISSSSEEEEEETDEEEEEDGGQYADSELDHRWGEAPEDAERVEEATPRLAVCNMDWDRIKAQDIFTLLNSFKTPEGLIHSVKIFPSEFGRERMAEENLLGPRELREKKEDVAASDGSEYQTEILRKYQLNRLKYYYAVVECDSAETADRIYSQCDGLEYETSSTKLDLRFIPAVMEFDETPTSVCTEQPDKSSYQPALFYNSALSQSKVELTWDETDRERVQKTQNVFNKKSRRKKKQEVENEDDDLQAYLASSSDEEAADPGGLLDLPEEEEGDASDEDSKIARYKLLMSDLEKQESKQEDRQDYQMEITWEPGLKETTQDLLMKKKKKSKELTPWEGYLEKKKEKKKKKREDKNKKKKKESNNTTEASDEEAGGVAGEMVEAFSDDDISGMPGMEAFCPEDLQDAVEEKPHKKKDKRKKRKRKQEEEVPSADEKEKSKMEAELRLLMDEEDNKRHFNMKKLVEASAENPRRKKKQKKTQENEDDFKINVSDSRFSAMYDSHHFNIDPSAPEFRKTEGTEAIISEKLKRRKDNPAEGHNSSSDKSKTVTHSNGKLQKDSSLTTGGSHPASSSQPAASLAALVKSVKMKTKKFQDKKK